MQTHLLVALCGARQLLGILAIGIVAPLEVMRCGEAVVQLDVPLLLNATIARGDRGRC